MVCAEFTRLIPSLKKTVACFPFIVFCTEQALAGTVQIQKFVCLYICDIDYFCDFVD